MVLHSRMPFKEKRLVESDQNDSLSLRDLTTRLLAKEYLDAAESNLELRAYALENILPSLTLAMENLSVEVQKRGIDSLPLGGPQVAPAAEKPFGTVDEISFNPLNWLGAICNAKFLPSSK